MNSQVYSKGKYKLGLLKKRNLNDIMIYKKYKNTLIYFYAFMRYFFSIKSNWDGRNNMWKNHKI